MHGLQENTNDDKKETFFNKIDEEVKSAQLAGTMICIEMDANSKLGSGDSKPQSKNGKYLQQFIENNDLVCVVLI